MKLCDDVVLSNATKTELFLIKLINDDSVYKFEGALIDIIKMIQAEKSEQEIIDSLVKSTGHKKEDVTKEFKKSIDELVKLNLIDL